MKGTISSREPFEKDGISERLEDSEFGHFIVQRAATCLNGNLS
jgi:hypothetical protein